MTSGDMNGILREAGNNTVLYDIGLLQGRRYIEDYV